MIIDSWTLSNFAAAYIRNGHDRDVTLAFQYLLSLPMADRTLEVFASHSDGAARYAFKRFGYEAE
jgi:hypothetical protein